MYLNFKKINSADREPPMLRLQTLAGKELGPIPFVQGLNFEINYSDLSTIEFSVPFMANGMINPLYDALTGYKVIYTEELGVYLITNPEKSGEGVKEIKQVKGYSLEYALQKKALYLDEGTYCFWNPAFPKETILGRIVELDPNWSVGYVDPRLTECYRTFDQYDNSALSFCYGEAMEKYRCVIVFDVYNKTINAYDASDDAVMLPIYLDYENLVQSVKVKEDNENMATLLHLYGGDDLTIRDVNPINSDYIVDLGFFLNNGDLDVVPNGSTEMLSTKVRRWQADVKAQQSYYTGLSSLRAATTARKAAAQAALNTLNGDLQSLTAQQMVLTKEYSLEKTDSGRANKQAQLDAMYAKIEAKNAEITAKQSEITSIESEIEGYKNKISAVASALSINGYFTEEERLKLTPFLIEGEVSEETFVASDVDSSGDAVSMTVTGAVSITDSEISRITLSEYSRTVYTLSEGKLSVSGIYLKDSNEPKDLTAKIIRGTMDVKSANSYVLTAYLGTTDFDGHDFSKGMITIVGTLSGLSSDIAAVTEESITQYLGSRMSFQTSGANGYFTIASSEYQQYAVELELYDFGTDALKDYAWPVYEFDIETSNFLYHEKFEPFKNKLELGKGVYLRLGSEGLVCPKVIGVKLDYDDISKFNLIFSNRYQRRDELEYLNEEIHNSTKTTSRFNASKYVYDRTADKMTDVDLYMKNMLDTAVQTIKAASNQSVIIDSAGIHVSSDNDNIQLRIVNGMIAMSDDNWKTSKLAIGRFYSEDHDEGENDGYMWGVNAELIAGKLLLGSSLYIQTEGGAFTVDNNGARIDSLQFKITHGPDDDGDTLGNIFDNIDESINNVSDSVTSVREDFDSVTKTVGDGLYLDAQDLNGLIDTVYAQMTSCKGNLLFDETGMWLMDTDKKDTAKNAVWINGAGIQLMSREDTADDWTEKTALNSKGVVAETIVAGTLSGMTISGGSITIGKGPATTDKDFLNINTNGRLGIGYVSGTETADDSIWRFRVKPDGSFSSAWDATNNKYNFKVDTDGNINANNLTVTNGSFSGSLSAANGTFTGTLNAAKISGNLSGGTDGWLVGAGIKVGENSDADNGYNFYVDRSGNVWMEGDLTLKNGAISWDSLDSNAHTKIDNAETIAKNIANGTYDGGTFINGKNIYSPTIYADTFVVKPKSKGDSEYWTGGYSMYGYYYDKLYEMLKIGYGEGDAPWVIFTSPVGAYAQWGFTYTEVHGILYCKDVKFTGALDFSGATVSGLKATAVFG